MPNPTAAVLRQLLDRLDRLYEERDGITAGIRDVYAEAKALGFDGKTLRKARERRKMRPDDRREADMLLETYEAALRGEVDDDEPLPDARPDVAALAHAMLSAQIIGLEDPERAALLAGHVFWLLDHRAEIAEMRLIERERKKAAEADGFDKNQIGVTVRWFEKVARHGEAPMRAGEAVFHQYRGTVEGAQVLRQAQDERGEVELTGDPKLRDMFAKKPPGKTTRRTKSALDAAALARAARQAGEG